MLFGLASTTTIVGMLFRRRVAPVFLAASILLELGVALLQQNGVTLPQIFSHSPLSIWLYFA
jgi:hypothetical protein